MNKPKISIAIPYYSKMENAEFFMNRCLESIKSQTYKDYEIVITDKGSMAENSNRAIKQAKGDIIKLLYQDDYFTNDNALQVIADAFKGGWLVTGCVHDLDGSIINPHMPEYPETFVVIGEDGKEKEWSAMVEGGNTIGSPSVVAFENKDPLLFDENLGWTLDCDLYHRLHERYGEPTYLYEYCTVIGVHPGQATNILSNNEKLKEQQYLYEKYTSK